MKQYVRLLPAVHEIKEVSDISRWIEDGLVNQEQVTSFIQEATQKVRTMLLQEIWQSECSKEAFAKEITNDVLLELRKFNSYQLQRVINATGTILHTNLGRAKLSQEAVEQVVLTAQNYSNLEYKLGEGTRGSRHDLIEDTVKMVTGAEAAMVVNNNAAAVYLVLKALAKGKEVIVSRGELVEIGGSFRVSSIMAESGAMLVEVGTTNKTHLFDYEHAISEQTAMMMKVHTSNFKTIGFTSSVSIEQLLPFKTDRPDIILYEDLGSGAIYDFREHKIGQEPTVSQALRNGADIVTFSGDKLLGGPQAGIIAGKKEIITKLKKHQLARVLRVDKMTLAALEATLKTYIKGKDHLKDIPTVRMIIEDTPIVSARAEVFLALLRKAGEWQGVLEEGFSQIGGGTMPDVLLPTVLAEITHPKSSAQVLADMLRNSTPAVVARIKEDKLIFDFRTIAEEEIPLLVEIFEDIQERIA